LTSLPIFSDLREFNEKIQKKYNQKFPRVLCNYLGNKLEISISSYKYIERILTSTKFITKSSLYSFLGNVLGNGLLFSSNQKWFERRKIITPTFHFKILSQFFDVFQKQSKNLCREFENAADGRIFDITPYISMTVLKSLCGKLQ
jgi:cytochrome P450 family 4